MCVSWHPWVKPKVNTSTAKHRRGVQKCTEADGSLSLCFGEKERHLATKSTLSAFVVAVCLCLPITNSDL